MGKRAAIPLAAILCLLVVFVLGRKSDPPLPKPLPATLPAAPTTEETASAPSPRAPEKLVEPHFAPSRVVIDAPSQPLAFSLEAATIGDRSLLPEDRTPVEPRRSGDEVIYLHGAVTEKYVLQGNGVEQIFVLDSSLEPLRSGGDLRILINLDTTRRASVVDGRTLEFHGDGPPLRYGAATAIDAAGRSRELSYRLVDQKLEMILDAEFLAEASFPLTIDPLIGFAQALSFNARYPAAAYSPAADCFLVVGESFTPNIRACVATVTGGVTTEIIVNPVNSVSRAPRVARSNTNQFLVVWEERPGTTMPGSILGRFVTVTNDVPSVSGPVFTISTGSDDSRPDVGFSTTTGIYLVAWERTLPATGNKDIYAATVSAAGVVSAPFGIATGPLTDEKPTVAPAMMNPTGVVWVRRVTPGSQGDIYASCVDVTVPSATTPTAVSTDPAAEDSPSLGGTGFLGIATWSRTAPAGDSDIWARQLSFNSGGPTLGVPFVVDNLAQHTTNPHCDKASPGAQRAIVTYSRNPTFPATAGGTDVTAKVYDTAVDPPVLIETLTVTSTSGDQDFSRITLCPTTLMALDVYDNFALYGVRLVTGTSPAFGLSRKTIPFSAQQGINPFSQSMQVHNLGGGLLNWTATSSQPWLTVPASGTTASGGSSSLTVSANVAGLLPGDYAATITFTDAGAVNSPRTVDVTLIVSAVTWVTPPSGTFVGGQLLSYSWNVASGVTPSTTNLVQMGTSSLPSGSIQPNQAGPPGTFNGSVEAPIVAAPTIYYFRAFALIGGQSIFSPVVNVTVTPPTSPIIALNQTALSFVAAREGPNPGVQNVTLSNTGIGSLNFTATTSAPWLQASPPSGSRPGGTSEPLAVWVDGSGLAPGSYSGTVTITAAGAVNSPKTIPVTLNVISADWVTPPPASVTSGQSVPVSWSVNAGSLVGASTRVVWATTTPPTTQSSTSSQSGPTGVFSGSFAAPIVTSPTTYYFAAEATANSSQTLSTVVPVVVNPSPALVLGAAALNFIGVSGGVNPATQSVKVTNTGVGTMNWTATTTAPWLAATPSGSLSSGTFADIVFTVNLTGLAPGTYTDTVTVAAAGATNSPKTIAVSLLVGSVNWVSAPSGTFTSGQTISFSWNVAGGGWVSTVNRVTYGTLNPPLTGLTTANQPGPSGTHSGSVLAPPVTSPTTYFFQASAILGGMSFSSPVASVLVNPSLTPQIGISPSSLSFVAPLGGANPPAKTFALTNTGSVPLNWTASGSQAWVAVTPSAGSLPAGASQTMTVLLSTAALPLGTNSATVTVTDPAAPNSPLDLPVTASIISTSWVAPPSGTYTSGQPIPVSWNVAVGGLTTGFNWVRYSTVNPPFGGSGTSNQVGSSGTYSATITAPFVSTPTTYYFAPQVGVDTATANGPIASVTILPVTTPVIQLMPGPITFSAQQGGSNPISQFFWITNAGVGVLNWSASSDQPWLTINPASGTLAAGMTSYTQAVVSIAGLAGGTHTATISVTDPAAGNSPQTISVVLNIAGASSNDNFAGRITLTGADATGTGSNIGATGEAGETGGSSPYHTLWWTWTAPISGPVAINTYGSTFDTYVTVFTGTALGSLTIVGSDDDSGPGNTSLANFTATAGTTYQIQVDGWSGSMGSIVVNVVTGPRIAVDQSNMSFVMAPTGGAAKTFTISSIGAGSLNWTATTDQPWLTVAVPSGTLSPGSQLTMSAGVTPGGLPAGTYTGTVTIADPAAVNSPQTFTVTMTIVQVSWVSPPGAGYTGGQPIPLSWNVASGAVAPVSTAVNYGTSSPPSFFATGGLQGPPGVYTGTFIAPLVTAPTVYYLMATATVQSSNFNSPIVPVVIVPPGPRADVGPTNLAFVCLEGGAAPTPGSLVVSNSGGQPLSWSAIAGAPWLTVSPPSGVLAAQTFHSASVSINPAGLAAGTYTGTVTIVDPDDATGPKQIVVSLLVVKLAWVTPPPAAATSGQLIPATWSLVCGTQVTTHNSVHYGTNNPPEGGFASGALNGGTGNHYTEFTAPAVATPTTWFFQPHVTILGTTLAGPVVSSTINPATGPFVGLSPSELIFNAFVGGASPPSQTVTVSNPGVGTLNWTATGNVAWLGATPLSGSSGAGGSQPLTVSVNSTGLTAGTYAGTVTVTAPGAGNSPRLLPVRLVVAARPSITLSPTTLAFNAVQGATTLPFSTTFTISNSGGQPLQWTASKSAGWLSFNPSSGTLNPFNGQLVSVSVNQSGLLAGTYTDTITVSDPAASNSPQTVTVTFAIHPPVPRFLLTPNSVAVTAVVGQSSPQFNFINVGNSGVGMLNFSASSNVPWLSGSPMTGSVTTGSSITVTTSVNPAGLAAGTYNGTITFTSSGASNSPQTLPVTLTVVPSGPRISMGQSALVFHAAQGGSNPARQTLLVSNAGTGTLQWSGSTGGTPWLQLNPGLGVLGQSFGQNISVGVDVAGLVAGTYNGTITITDAGAGNSPQTVAVALNVAPPGPSLALAPSVINAVVVEGEGAAQTSFIQVSNPGTATASWTATDDASWVTVSPSSGVTPAGATAMATVSIDASGLPAGDHTASLTFVDPGATNSPQTATIRLTVASTAWVTPPVGPFTSGQTIPFSWSATHGTAQSSFTTVYYSPLDPPWNGSTSLSHSGPEGTFSESIVAPTVSTPTVYYFGAQTFVGGVVARTAVVPVLINPPAVPGIALGTSSSFSVFAAPGSPPNVQTVFVTNSGTATLNWSASSNQPWLAVSPASGTRAPGSSQGLSLSADTAGLADGVHTALVTISDPAAPNSPVTVPYVVRVFSTAWVTPPTGSFVGGETIPFSWSTTGDTLTSSTNSVSCSTSNPLIGGNASANQPGPPGVYSGTIIAPVVTVPTTYFFEARTFVSSVMARSPVVAVVIYPPTSPLISLNQTSVSLVSSQGGANPQAMIQLSNPGTGTLNWTTSSSQPWLSGVPPSGALAAGGSTSVGVSADVAVLQPGVYLGTLTFSAASSISAPVAVQVTLTVGAPVPNDNFANRIALVGGTVTTTGSNVGATAEALEIGGSGVLNTAWWTWTAPAAGPVVISTIGSPFDTYLTVMTGSALGSLAIVAQDDDSGGSGASRVTITAAAGTVYQIQVDGWSSNTGAITLNISTLPMLSLTPTTLSFGAALGGPNPAGRFVSIQNNGPSTLNWTASSPEPWLNEAPASGSVASGGSQVTTVTVDVTGLAAGVYNGTITVADPAAGNSPQTIPVTLTVGTLAWTVPPPSTAVSGSSMPVSWSLSIGSSVASSNQVRFSTVNPPFTGIGGLNQPGPSGTYTDIMTVPTVSTPTTYYFAPSVIVANTTINGPIVSVIVNPGATLSVSPPSLGFAAVQFGAAPASQPLTVSNPGGAPLYWQMTALSGWLSADATSGVLAPGGSQVVNVSADTAGLAPGTYPGAISIQSLGSVNPAQNVAVTLTVSADATAPTVADVTSATSDGTYGAGEPVNVTVNFSEPVILANGALEVALNTGAVVSIAPFGPATSAVGTYIVGAGQSSPALAATGLTLQAGATLRDQAGNTAALAIPAGQNIPNFRTIVIDATIPALTVTSPPGPTFSTTTSPLLVTGTAFDSQGVASVTWSNGATGQSGVATGTTSWSALIPLKPGSNLITIIVWDAAGNTDSRQILVDYTPPDTASPVVQILFPSTAPSFTAPVSPVVLQGTAVDNVGATAVRWTNGTTGATGTAAGTGSWTAQIPLAGGANVITVTAEDAAGNTGSITVTVGLIPPTDVLPPVITIQVPTSASTHPTSTSPLGLRGMALDNIGVAVVTWSNTTLGVSGVASGTTSWSADVPLAAGSNTVIVTAEDSSGNFATDSLIVTFTPPGGDAIPPIVAIQSPTSAPTLVTGANPVVLGGTAADNVAVTSIVWSNGATGQSGSVTGLSTWSASVGLVSGANAITVTATDSSGNTAAAVITVTLVAGGGGGAGKKGGGGCGLTGLEAMLALGLLHGFRRKVRTRPIS